PHGVRFGCGSSANQAPIRAAHFSRLALTRSIGRAQATVSLLTTTVGLRKRRMSLGLPRGRVESDRTTGVPHASQWQVSATEGPPPFGLALGVAVESALTC